MILKEIVIKDFGIYGGSHTFDLSLATNEHFNRPIILLRGKNGVGKSTLVEAIRLCLHGSLSLGNRVGQRQYESYLRNRLHHRRGAPAPVSEAAIYLSFEYAAVGQLREYRVERVWSESKSGIVTSVNIWENGKHLDVPQEEREAILRELVPVGVADLFFFDGEKIGTLADAGVESDLLLAETVKNLLGLHLVEQLDHDLEVFLTRQRNVRELHVQQMELDVLRSEESELRQQYEYTRTQLHDCRQRLFDHQKAIAHREQELAAKGGSLASQKQRNEARRQQILISIAGHEQAVFELCRELVPFSMAPKLLRATRDRLVHEAEYDRWVATQNTLVELKSAFAEAAAADWYWQGIADSPDLTARQRHIEQIDSLFSRYDTPPMSEDEVLHPLSSETRGKLLDWIDTALVETPRALAVRINQLSALREELRKINLDLDSTPQEESLAPIQEQLRQLDREHGRFEAERERLIAEERKLEYLLERNAGSRRRVSEQIAQIRSDDGRLQLAARTKLLLAEYQRQLVQQKLKVLEIHVTKRFNQLCRKRDFIERVEISENDYRIALYRNGRLFPRHQLSAGEQQLFAIATLWALREVSGRPLPVIIDTPLSRLDTEHRQSMIEEFFTQVAHQVIILATDAEIDERTSQYLQPAVSRAYVLVDELESGSSGATVELTQETMPLIRLEEVYLDA